MNRSPLRRRKRKGNKYTKLHSNSLIRKVILQGKNMRDFCRHIVLVENSDSGVPNLQGLKPGFADFSPGALGEFLNLSVPQLPSM